MPLAAEKVGAGYETGDEPVSGRVNIANGPAISKPTSYCCCIGLLPVVQVRLELRMELTEVVADAGRVRELSGIERLSEVSCALRDRAEMGREVVTNPLAVG
jgi:hypothetical protein